MALTFTSASDRYRILSALRGCLDGQCTDAGIRLIGTSGERPREVSNWRRTGFNGSVIETGAFGLGDVGDHTLSIAIN